MKQEEIKKDTKKKPKYKLDELLKNCKPENRHEEIITDTQGKELI